MANLGALVGCGMRGLAGGCLLLGTMAAVVLGCDKRSIAYLEITAVTQPPLPATVSPQRIELADGLALAVDVVAYDDENEQVDQLVALSGDFEVLGVEENETEGRWVIYGASVGTADMSFNSPKTDGVLEIPVTVTAQP